MIVVNDGSTDSTGQILTNLQDSILNLTVIHQKNGGHGNALLRGMTEALNTSCDWIFHVDSDNQFIPQDFLKLWKKREKSSFILGIRQHRKDNWHRLVISFFLRIFIFLIFQVQLKDSNVPFRLIKTSYLRFLLNHLPRSTFAPNIFMSILAKIGRKNFIEIPISHKSRSTGKITIVGLNLLKACFRSLVEIIIFRINIRTAFNFNDSPEKELTS